MTLAIIQARVGSSRLWGKVLKKIDGISLIELLLKRLSQSEKVDKIIVATSINVENDLLSKLVKDLGFDVFRGSEEDVLDRYFNAAKLFNPSAIIRITGDCPLIDHSIVDSMIECYYENKVDYLSNIDPPTYPDGLDVEIFSFKALKVAFNNATKPYEREHVTPYIRKSKSLKLLNFFYESDHSQKRWTVDDMDDFEVVEKIFKHFNYNYNVSWTDVLQLSTTNPEYFFKNRYSLRNQGSKMSKGEKLYKRAKKIIPGGTSLLSKRPEMFLPDFWPTYFSKAKGVNVWDLDSKKYIDMSIMGIGTNILGYGHLGVDNAVREVINNGNMSTLNCPEEVELAERLIALHPWADMVRFARTGGEANAMAIRIARAASGKDKVAICGYHGWHDWYLAANLNEDNNLDGHLIPGLIPNGVPKALQGSVVPFEYNNFNNLEEITNTNDIGIIKMEVSRTIGPEAGFLESVRKLADEKNIILIFDECTSGFRETFGGLHKKFNVNPDIMMLGKTLGNGYAITTVLGREEIMKYAQDTFISSTFWTERIGPVAALQSLKEMEKEKSWEKITKTGEVIVKKWKVLANKYQLPITITGLPALSSFTFPLKNWLKYKTFITQEMLNKGYLASNSIYTSIEHKNDIIVEYFSNLDPVFGMIADCENGRDIDELLKGPICHEGFKRLN